VLSLLNFVGRMGMASRKAPIDFEVISQRSNLLLCGKSFSSY
jgi:hypothetical protein